MEKETKAMMGEKEREGEEGIDMPLLMRDKFLFCQESEREHLSLSLLFLFYILFIYLYSFYLFIFFI